MKILEYTLLLNRALNDKNSKLNLVLDDLTLKYVRNYKLIFDEIHASMPLISAIKNLGIHDRTTRHNVYNYLLEEAKAIAWHTILRETSKDLLINQGRD